MRGSTGIATSESARAAVDAQRLGIGRAGSRACGNAIEVRLLLEGPHDTISELGVVTRGQRLPGNPSELVTLFVGMSVAQALEVTHREIAIRLGGLPESQMYCSVLLHEALRAAVASTRQGPDASDRNHRPCVTCRCFSVAEDLIQRAVRLNGLTRLDEVACFTRAGSGCGLCVDAIAAILSSARRDPYHGHGATYLGPATATPANDE
jgi:NifU-like protein